ncbi:MAG: cytochrome P450, partial [Leptolyngbyaceae bacterium]|nr:cytochrome P450 [Leptolyngbyaceae bacterium]
MTTTQMRSQPHSTFSPKPDIDGPKAKGLIRFLRVFHLILRPTEYMDDKVQRYGPMFKIGGETRPPLIYVGDPDVVRELFMLDATQLHTAQGGILRTMVGEHSMLLLDGDAHQRQRKLLMPPFHGDRLRGYAQLIC